MKAYRDTKKGCLLGKRASRGFDISISRRFGHAFYLQSLHYRLRDSPFNGVYAKEITSARSLILGPLLALIPSRVKPSPSPTALALGHR